MFLLEAQIRDEPALPPPPPSEEDSDGEERGDSDGEAAAGCRTRRSGSGKRSTGVDTNNLPVKRKVIPRKRAPGCFSAVTGKILLLLAGSLFGCGSAENEVQREHHQEDFLELLARFNAAGIHFK